MPVTNMAITPPMRKPVLNMQGMATSRQRTPGADHPSAGGKLAIAMNITDRDGNKIEKFDINHEKLMHLIIVSRDLSEFYHLHPDYEGEGVFRQEAVLPSGGEYRLFADFKPTGGEQATLSGSVHVSGDEPGNPLVPDTELTEEVDGTTVSLSLSTMKAGEASELTFSFADAGTNKPVKDLEPYLGAIGHVVIVGEGAEHYLHVHAENGNGSGPDAVFATTFPEPGTYRIWGQFQRNGKTFIAPFTVKVE
ncbi:hypothetical protein RB620_18205 [Paenibacillus sp. LHD-117]|uniref:hypothetical protein n=1 Tax=Paenibacillus sp. LHD-117 TaxID=3071412 RepID=UPI0027DF0D47|nr:hypothetical protein [Paenibacillus sp. LHD-117]MDQ6421363.1 hypothetical protein [Paenibacillus sp. LHD-117]